MVCRLEVQRAVRDVPGSSMVTVVTGQVVWHGPIARCGSRRTVTLRREARVESLSWGMQQWECCYHCRCLQRNEQCVCQHQHIDRIYSPSSGHSSLLSSPVFSERLRSHSDYLAAAVLHCTAPPRDHVLSCGPQQQCWNNTVHSAPWRQ